MRRALPLVLLPLLACGDSSGPDVVLPAELVGGWVAEPACAPPCSFALAWTANPQARFDAVTSLGITVRINVTSAGRFTRSGTGDAESGQARVEGSTLIVRSDAGVVDTIDYVLQGTDLHLDFRREFTEVDFNGDGQLDPAHVTGVFRRR